MTARQSSNTSKAQCTFSRKTIYLRHLAAVCKGLRERLADLVFASKLPAEALHKYSGSVGLPASCKAQNTKKSSYVVRDG